MKQMKTQSKENKGFILLPIILTLAVLAAVALLISREGVINTGSVIREHQPENIRYIADAALAIGQKELALDTDCSAFSVTGSGTFNGHSYTASVNPTNGSPVTLDVNVDQDGVTKQFSRQITMYTYIGVDHLTNASQDTHIRSTNNSTNYNSGSEADKLHVKYGTGFFPDRMSFLQFDLQGFIDLGISTTDIQSATMELHSGGSAQVNTVDTKVRRVTANWNEDQATYLERLTGVSWSLFDVSLTNSAQTTVDENVIGWKTWEITTLVKDWLDGTYTNYGVALLGEKNNSNNIEFISQNDPDTAKRPTLRITYNSNAVGCP